MQVRGQFYLTTSKFNQEEKMQLKKVLIRSVIIIMVLASLVSILTYASLQYFFDSWKDQAMNSVKTKLEKPNDAKFRNVHVVWGGQLPMVCGEVSSDSNPSVDSVYLKFWSGICTKTLLQWCTWSHSCL